VLLEGDIIVDDIILWQNVMQIYVFNASLFTLTVGFLVFSLWNFFIVNNPLIPEDVGSGGYISTLVGLKWNLQSFSNRQQTITVAILYVIGGKIKKKKQV